MKGESNLIQKTSAFYLPNDEWLLLDKSKQSIDQFSLIVAKKPIHLLELYRLSPSTQPTSDEISKYSHKISNICDIIKISTGIVLIYSQFIDGGVVPMALALEELDGNGD